MFGQRLLQLGDRSNPAAREPSNVGGRNIIKDRVVIYTGENREAIKIAGHVRVARDMEDVSVGGDASARHLVAQEVHQREVGGAHRPTRIMSQKPEPASRGAKSD